MKYIAYGLLFVVFAIIASQLEAGAIGLGIAATILALMLLFKACASVLD